VPRISPISNPSCLSERNSCRGGNCARPDFVECNCNVTCNATNAESVNESAILTRTNLIIGWQAQMYFARTCIDTTVAPFSLDLSSRIESRRARCRILDVFTKTAIAALLFMPFSCVESLRLNSTKRHLRGILSVLRKIGGNTTD